jgi:hypothetical protein
MSSVNLQLTIANGQFSITPLPAQVGSPCTAGHTCRQRATHRLIWSGVSGVELLCDVHAIAWAGDNGLQITTARFNQSSV